MNARAFKTLGAFFVGLVVLALSVPSGFAQQKIEGMVVALKITQCGMKPGSCKGLVEIGEPERPALFRSSQQRRRSRGRGRWSS